MKEYHFYSEVTIMVSEYIDDVSDILVAEDLDYLVDRWQSRGGMLEPYTLLDLKDTTTSAECDEIISVLEERGLKTKKI